jgi:hypothetical protein|tara:strand:+ start:669 stop:1064 length:396 start_codon:yes stop_codon:yes gene_type:complete
MKRFELKRISSSHKVTIGALIDLNTGLPVMVTLELPNRNNQRSISCIPKGIYLCNPYSSKKHKDVYQLMDVSDRSYILIHIGNTVKDIEGCILVGSEFGELNGVPAVLESRKAFNRLQSSVGEESFELVIT